MLQLSALYYSPYTIPYITLSTQSERKGTRDEFTLRVNLHDHARERRIATIENGMLRPRYIHRAWRRRVQHRHPGRDIGRCPVLKTQSERDVTLIINHHLAVGATCWYDKEIRGEDSRV